MPAILRTAGRAASTCPINRCAFSSAVLSVRARVELGSDPAKWPEHLGRQQQRDEGGAEVQLPEDEAQSDADRHHGDAERRQEFEDERGHERDPQRRHRRTLLCDGEFRDAVGGPGRAARAPQGGDARRPGPAFATAAWSSPVSAAAERSRVTRPMSTMNTGTSGSVITTMAADCRSLQAITITAAGVISAASISAGR